MAATAVAVMVTAGFSGQAEASRDPTRHEAAALTQATFDALYGHIPLTGPIFYGFRVATKGPPPIPAGSSYFYRTFAIVFALNPDRHLTYTLLFGYWSAPLSGWRLLSKTGGCDAPAAAFRGYKTVVLKDLEHHCP